MERLVGKDKVKVLSAFNPGSMTNLFVEELNYALGTLGVDVTSSLDHFWSCRSEFDIVHLHWPEHLFIRNNICLSHLKEILGHWNQNSKVVITRHNITPHARKKEQMVIYDKLYDLIYSHVHGVVHMGEFSQRQIKKAGYAFRESIIPHHIYRKDLLRYGGFLRTEITARYALVAGAIRSEPERCLLKFIGPRLIKSGIKLVVPAWGRFEKDKYKHPLEYMLFKWEALRMSLGSNIKIGHSLVSEERLARLSQQCMFIVVPRIDSLNSGLVTHGFSHGKVVIGENYGNIGEVLRDTSNPTFNAYDYGSIDEALAEGLRLVENNHGEKNRKYALRYLQPAHAATKYLSFFHLLKQ